MAQGNVPGEVWRLFGKGFFIDVLRNGNYTKEKELLQILRHWQDSFRPYQILSPSGDVLVDLGAFLTHQAYIRGVKGHREFGDITFATYFSSDNESRIGYVNAFQIKVSTSAADAYKDLFHSHANQLNFYRTSLIEAMGGPHPEICDFLYYWFIGNQRPHELKEVPLSFTWVGPSLNVESNRYYMRYTDLMLRCMLLTTGVNVSFVSGFCAPKLRRILNGIAKVGVSKMLEAVKDDPPDDPPREPPQASVFEYPEYPISSSIVIAMEARVKE